MKVAVIVLGDPTTSPRPRHLIRYLRSKGHDVITMGSEKSDRNLCMYRYTNRLTVNIARFLFRRYDKIIDNHVPTGCSEWLLEQSPDVVVLHDLKLLPWLQDVGGDWKTVVDLQEYYPDMLSSLKWKFSLGALYKHIIDKHLPRVYYCWTVSEQLQHLYMTRHGIVTELVPNVPFFNDLSIRHDERRDRLSLVHHGLALPDRNILAMIDAVGMVNGVSLDLVLIKSPHWPKFYDKVKARAERARGVRLVDPGPIDDIVPSKNHYDAGLYVLAPENKNMSGAMPNKLYDFIQARIATICGPDGEMSKLVRELKIGFTTFGYGPRAIADRLTTIKKEDILQAKVCAGQMASSLSYESLCAPVIDLTLDDEDHS